MTFLPVVERELRVAARRPSVFWARLVAAAIAVLFGASTLWLGSDWRSSADLGASIFHSLAAVAFFFCLGAGPLFTADVVSEERREGTLGLLFLTDLRGYDVVLGKLVASSVPALFGLLSVLPVLAIPFLLGGVPLGEFGRVVLVLVNTLFLSLALGIGVSAVTVQARSAFALAGFGLFMVAGFVPWLESAWREARGPGAPTYILLALGPTPGLSLASPIRFAQAAEEFWVLLAGNHALAWLCLGFSAFATARVWQEARRPLLTRWRERWHDWNYGPRAARLIWRRELLERNPLLWLGSRHRLKRLLFHGVVLLALGVWLVVLAFAGGSAVDWGSVFFAALFIQAPVKWLMASEASQRWTSERQHGALELLLTTPLTVPEIVEGHWLALRRLFWRPVAAIVTVEILVMVGSGFYGAQDKEMGALALANLVVFLWDLHALGWVGLWLGLAKRKPNQAFNGTLFRILVVPFLVFLGGIFLMGVTHWLMLPVLWLFVCGACNVFFTLDARGRLFQWFRQISAGQAGQERPAAPPAG